MTVNDKEVILKRGDDFNNLNEQTNLKLDSTFNAFSYNVKLYQERSLCQWDFIWIRKFSESELAITIGHEVTDLSLNTISKAMPVIQAAMDIMVRSTAPHSSMA